MTLIIGKQPQTLARHGEISYYIDIFTFVVTLFIVQEYP